MAGIGAAWTTLTRFRSSSSKVEIIVASACVGAYVGWQWHSVRKNSSSASTPAQIGQNLFLPTGENVVTNEKYSTSPVKSPTPPEPGRP